jgi:hypothetical protein
MRKIYSWESYLSRFFLLSFYVVGYFQTENKTPQSSEVRVFGEVVKKNEHPLFIGDGFETQVAAKLKSWMIPQFIFSGILVFGGMALQVGFFQNHFLKSRTAPGLNVQLLHSQCVEGKKSSCLRLIENQDRLRLPEINL